MSNFLNIIRPHFMGILYFIYVGRLCKYCRRIFAWIIFCKLIPHLEWVQRESVGDTGVVTVSPVNTIANLVCIE
jgi:hypothetical protein